MWLARSSSATAAGATLGFAATAMMVAPASSFMVPLASNGFHGAAALRAQGPGAGISSSAGLARRSGLSATTMGADLFRE